jgi:hypothetical protein
MSAPTGADSGSFPLWLVSEKKKIDGPSFIVPKLID